MIKKAYVDTREGQIHYRYSDNSKNLPILVMIHQTTSTSIMFEPVMIRLEKQYHMIAPDFPGYGASFQPDEVPDISYYADVLLEALDNLGVGKFHVFGHHTGGGIALDMAARFPERILTLGIVGPIYATIEERVELKKITTEKAKELIPKRDGSHLLFGWKMLETYGAAQLPVEFHHQEAMDHLTAWKACNQAYKAIVAQDFSGLFDTVKPPLFIMCSHDDVLWPYFPKARAARPDAEWAVVKGPDYQCTVDPDGVADALDRFLQKHIQQNKGGPKAMKRTHAMLLLTYTPRKGIDLDQYHQWLKDVDNPFFNSRPGVKHYSNWRVVEDKLGKSSFTHFDLLYIKDLNSFEEVFGDQAVDDFARGWVRLWGENPDPDAPDQSVNYHVYLCEQIAGPPEV